MQRPTDSVLVHLYRGELSRLVAYRARLDTTTNWAIGVSAALISFGLGDRAVPHAVFLFAIALDLLFLVVEARRYRAYQLSHHRVRLLERGMIGADPGEWWEAARESYIAPRPPIGLLAAVARRIRRNYLGLVGSVLAAWLFKVRLHGGGLPSAAALGPVPGTVTLGCAALLLLALVGSALAASSEPIEG